MGSRWMMVVVVVAMGCGVPQDEVDQLREELGTVQAQLHECQHGAAATFGKAELEYDRENYLAAKNYFNDLIERYPQSSEASEAKSLLSRISEIEQVKEEQRIKEAAEAQEKAEAEKRKKLRSLESLVKKHDEMEGITWYHDKSKSSYKNSLHLYLGHRESGKAWMRMVCRYYGDGWLFTDRIVIRVDDKNYILDYDPGDLKRDTGSGGSVWETLDMTVRYTDVPMLQAIAAAKSVKVRMSGDRGYEEFRVSSSRRAGIGRVLDAYEALDAL